MEKTRLRLGNISTVSFFTHQTLSSFVVFIPILSI